MIIDIARIENEPVSHCALWQRLDVRWVSTRSAVEERIILQEPNGVVVIGGGVVLRHRGTWSVQSRIHRYLDELCDELGPVTFFASVVSERLVGAEFLARLSDARVCVVPIELGGARSRLRQVRHMVADTRRLAAELKRKPAVIHFFPASGGLLGLGAMTLRARAHLTYLKSDWIEYTWQRAGPARLQTPYWALSELAEARVADAMVFRSVAHLERLRPWTRGLVEPAQPMLATNGELFPDTAPSIRERNSETLTILYVGGLYRRKGLDDLVRALSQLGRQGVPPFELVLVGGQALEDETAVPRWLSRTIDACGLSDSVRSVGYIDDGAALAAYYRAASFLVVPSKPGTEGFPRVIDEAMSFGVPVLSTAVSGIPHVLENGRDALLVEPENAGALERALRDLLTSADLRRKLGEAGRRSYERRVTETAAKQHARLIRRAWHVNVRSAGS